MSWASGTNKITASGSDNSIADATSLSEVTELNANHKVYSVVDAQIEIASGGEWEDVNILLVQEQSASLYTVNFASDTAWIKLGTGNLTTPLKPILNDGCAWHIDENGHNTSNEFLNGSQNGNLHIFGGVLEVNPYFSGGNTVYVNFPNDEVRIIGVNWHKFSGCVNYGSDFRMQELKCGGAWQQAYSGGNTSDSVGIKSFLIYGCNRAYWFVGTTPNSILRDIGTRGITTDANIGNTESTIKIIDSSEITTATSTFLGSGNLSEISSFNVHCIDEDGDDIVGVNARTVRTLRAAGAGSWSKSTGIGDLAVPYEIDLSDTDSNGELDEILLVRRYWDDIYETISTRLRFGGFYVTLRKYGYFFEDIAVVPEFGPGKGLVKDYVLQENGFIDQATQATVDAYTGIVINKQGKVVALQETHTMQEIYDYLQSWCTKDAQMNFEVSYDSDGIPGTSEACPITTGDGILFTLGTGWVLEEAAYYLDLDGKILETSGSDRWVTIKITDMVENASFTIVRDSDDHILYGGTSSDSGIFSSMFFWEQSNINVTVSVRLQGYLSYSTQAQITNAGLSIVAIMLKDGNYKNSDGRVEQRHFRWRNDNGSETTATWAQNEDTNHTGLAKQSNIRLRIQLSELKSKSNTVKPKLQYRKVGEDYWSDVGE